MMQVVIRVLLTNKTMIKKKIALFSPYCSQNYGTVLQAFALAKVIQELGADCEYITWKRYPEGKKALLKFMLKHPMFYYRLKKFLNKRANDLDYSFLSEPPYRETISKNEEFCKINTPVNSQVYYFDELKGLESRYFSFIVGSDQTWSPSSLYQYSPHYLSFVKDHKKKNSYGCSMGTTSIPNSFKRFAKNNLISFSGLSCREQSNCTWLQESLKKEVTCVLDPTLLIGRECWNQYFKPVPINSRYILCYILGEKETICEYAELLGHRYNIPVYYILTRPYYAQKKNVLSGIGCEEFLWLIDNCELLVTDSFHGSIFSINFNKNFIAFNKRKKGFDNGRLEEIVSLFGIDSCFHRDDDFNLPNNIDYKTVNNILDKKREESLSYLKGIVVK